MKAALPDADAVREALRTVVDPEAGIDIVDLGLVYEVDVSAGGIRVAMTTTSIACPTATLMVEQARDAVAAIAPDVAVDVQLVWDPPWGPELMSEAAKKKLGW